MSIINVSNLSFSYDGSHDNVFSNVSFSIDSDWKLGFVGRNGRGKTTFLKLLMGQFEYSGKISSGIKFDYFPFEVANKNLNTYEIAQTIEASYEKWAIDKELNQLDVSLESRYMPFGTLSGGEQTKILLAILFSRQNNFLLIDEPTNHLDAKARKALTRYLDNKKSFILVSHDREFLDGCVDHILSINRTNIEVQKGNFSSWLENQERQNSFELAENEKLNREIDRLKTAAKQKTNWSNAAELKKSGAADKGFMGAKAARQMKSAKILERRQENAIENKEKLLNNIETSFELKMKNMSHPSERLITAKNLSILYGDRRIFKNLDFCIERGDRVAILGSNGSGKTSILKLLSGQKIHFEGELNFASNLVVSYLEQDTSFLRGSLKDFCIDNTLDETLFFAILSKLDLKRDQFDKDIFDLSAGQKKKVLLAKSLSKGAHVFLWDEPLNFIDVLSRIQIENLIKDYCPTMVFVEHDNRFVTNIATKTISL